MFISERILADTYDKDDLCLLKNLFVSNLRRGHSEKSYNIDKRIQFPYRNS